jgi:hypothetical protein
MCARKMRRIPFARSTRTRVIVDEAEIGFYQKIFVTQATL